MNIGMSEGNPQFLYVILVLPGLFGLTLIGDGLSKVIHDEPGGLISIVFGLLFVVAVILAYLFFSTQFSS